MQIVQVSDPNLIRCPTCGGAFVRTCSTQRYCLDEGCRKKRLTAYVRQRYWADPVAARAKARTWHAAHLAQHRAYQEKHRTFPCSSCGKLTTQTIRKELRPTWLCRVCGNKARLITRPCWWCERSVARLPSRASHTKTSRHSECHGQEMALSLKLHLSHERVRQLIEKFKAAFPERSREKIGAALSIQAHGKRWRWILEGQPYYMEPPARIYLKPGHTRS